MPELRLYRFDYIKSLITYILDCDMLELSSGSPLEYKKYLKKIDPKDYGRTSLSFWIRILCVQDIFRYLFARRQDILKFSF